MSLISDAHRLDRGCHESLTVGVNLQTESDADPTQLEHTAAKGRAANRSFQCLGEVATTLDEGAPAPELPSVNVRWSMPTGAY
jgi:hypothetical protein